MFCLPMVASADGNCSYVSYQHCYANDLVAYPHPWIQALCFVKSDRKEGVFGAEDYNQCKTEARHLGQMVEVQYYDFISKKNITSTVYNEN